MNVFLSPKTDKKRPICYTGDNELTNKISGIRRTKEWIRQLNYCVLLQSSYDEEDALDVDYGNVRQFIDALITSGIGAFFPIKPERQNSFPWNSPDYYEKKAASLATVYASTLYDFLYDSYAEKAEKTGGKFAPDIDAMIANDPLWNEEAERIHSDLSLVRSYPANRDIVLQQAEIYRKLRTKPFCTD